MIIKDLSTIPSFLAGDHTDIKEVLSPSNDNLSIQYSLAHASLAVGKASLPHYLKSSEVYYILQGQGRVYINEESQIVKAGQVVFIPANATQYIENIGQETLTFLCIVDPAWRLEDEVIF